MRLSEIADLVGGELVGDDDPEITGAAGLEDAGPGDLTFVSRAALLPAAWRLRGASAVLLGPDMESDRPAVRCADPYRAFATVLWPVAAGPGPGLPAGDPPHGGGRPRRRVAAAASIGPYCVIGAGTTVGAGTRLGPHVALGRDVTVGRDCLLYAQVTVREGCRLGDRVVLQAGVVIGTDGFGYLPGAAGPEKIPQVGIGRGGGRRGDRRRLLRRPGDHGPDGRGGRNEDRQPGPDRAQCPGRSTLCPERPDGHLGQLHRG